MSVSGGLDASVIAAARVIYDFHFLGLEPSPGEVIVALGTNDLRVASHAVELYHQGFGAWLVCTGGVAHQGDLLETAWPQAEALMYRDVAVASGVPAAHVLVETEATNTAENFVFTRRLLAGREPESIVVAVKPFMQRRARATWRVHWPEVRATFSSPALAFEDYCTPELPLEKMIHIFMGDLQRLWIYGERGWSTKESFPAEVREAFAYLRERGWTRHLVRADDAGPFAV